MWPSSGPGWGFSRTSVLTPGRSSLVLSQGLDLFPRELPSNDNSSRALDEIVMTTSFPASESNGSPAGRGSGVKVTVQTFSFLYLRGLPRIAAVIA
jgi:hypothetical protein